MRGGFAFQQLFDFFPFDGGESFCDKSSLILGTWGMTMMTFGTQGPPGCGTGGGRDEGKKRGQHAFFLCVVAPPKPGSGEILVSANHHQSSSSSKHRPEEKTRKQQILERRKKSTRGFVFILSSLPLLSPFYLPFLFPQNTLQCRGDLLTNPKKC